MALRLTAIGLYSLADASDARIAAQPLVVEADNHIVVVARRIRAISSRRVNDHVRDNERIGSRASDRIKILARLLRGGRTSARVERGILANRRRREGGVSASDLERRTARLNDKASIRIVDHKRNNVASRIGTRPILRPDRPLLRRRKILAAPEDAGGRNRRGNRARNAKRNITRRRANYRHDNVALIDGRRISRRDATSGNTPVDRAIAGRNWTESEGSKGVCQHTLLNSESA